MTRKEERAEAAKQRANQYSHPAQWNDVYRGFISGSEWADKTMLDKVCNYLKTNLSISEDNSNIMQDLRNLIEDK